MKALELFEKVVALWPPDVDISDRSASHNGYWFLELAETSRGVEEAVDVAQDHWGNLGAWSFYQAAVSYASELYEHGQRTFRPASLPLALFDERVRENLRAPGFEDEAALYEPL